MFIMIVNFSLTVADQFDTKLKDSEVANLSMKQIESDPSANNKVTAMFFNGVYTTSTNRRY